MYTVAVTCSTHDFTHQETTYVRLVADGDVEAMLVATQVAHMTFPFEGMPVAAELLDFPTEG